MPLHDRIPREIFEIILHLCVGLDTPVRDLVTLQLVCRTWHDIIAEACFLWGTISTEEEPKAFRKAFQMAKASPLDIIFTDRSDIEASEFFSLAGKKIDQWRWLAIEAQRVEDVLTTIQNQKPPNLNLLSVESRGLMEPKAADIVLFGGAPVTGLEHLLLIGIPINLTPLRLSGLKSLLLQQIPSITAAEIITLLTDSPTLEILKLSTLKDAVLPTEPAAGEPNPIQLPFLTHLKLDDLPVLFLSFLLSNLVAPRLSFLKIIAKKPTTQLLAIGRHHPSPTLTSVTSGVQNYEVTIRTFRALRRYAITIGGLSMDLIGLSLDQETFDRLFDHLRGVVALADIPLHLTLEGSDPGHSDLEWFTRKTNVTWLTIFNKPSPNYDLVDIIPLLGRPTSGPSPIWLLPQIEVFETDLACRESQGLMVDMIKARHAALPESFPGLYGAFPKRFREIRLSHKGDKFPMPSPLETFMLEVIQAAEGAEVYWGGKKWTEFRDAGSPSTNSARRSLLPRTLA